MKAVDECPPATSARLQPMASPDRGARMTMGWCHGPRPSRHCNDDAIPCTQIVLAHLLARFIVSSGSSILLYRCSIGPPPPAAI